VPFSLKLCPRIRSLRSTNPGVARLNSESVFALTSHVTGVRRRKMTLAWPSGVSASCYGYMKGLGCRESLCEIVHLDFG
jgi:hypothetical protein